MSQLAEIKNRIQSLNNGLQQQLGKRQALQERQVECQAHVTRLESALDDATKASLFLQTLSDSARVQIVDKISAIVTDALQKVKDKNLEFKMVLSTERNQTDLKFFVVNKDTKQQYDILTSCGGGIADLVTFPLRVSLLMKWNPELSKVLILDEAFKFVSVADQEPLASFVRQVSEKLGIQIILVTHSGTLTNAAHRVFAVSRQGQNSTVEVRE